MSARDFLAAKAATLRARASRSPAELDALRERAAAMPRPASFGSALAAGHSVAVIAEFKRRSPSAGVLTDEAPGRVVDAYASAGARAASILTDGPDFGGSLDDLAASGEALPLLRKDFVLTAADVLESRHAGASALLLIVALLDDAALRVLLATARAVDLDCLVEVHDEHELTRAINAGAPLIGINNRDLRTLRTDLDVTARLAARARASGALVVSESGIRARRDVERVRDAGAHAVLVGETLLRVRGAERAALLAELAGVPLGVAHAATARA